MVDLRSGRGRRQRRKFTGKTKDDVLRKLNQARVSLDRGIPVVDGKRTLGEWLDQYLEEIVAPRVRPSTYKVREYMIRTYLKPYLGHKVLRDLAAMDVERFLHDLVKAGRTPNLANQARQFLVTALTQAVRRDLIY